jgi:hypothetical protein
MKIIGTLVFALLIFISCSKENNNNKLQTGTFSNLITADTAKIPLNDLGTGTYLGYMGGLYPRAPMSLLVNMLLICLKLATQ